MSIRTVIEINHDFLGDFDKETWEALVLVLKSGSQQEFNMRSELRGIRFLAQRHHSVKLQVTVE